MTQEQFDRIQYLTLNTNEKFTESDRDLLPGIHDCPEWDGPIFRGMSEWRACSCFPNEPYVVGEAGG